MHRAAVSAIALALGSLYARAGAETSIALNCFPIIQPDSKEADPIVSVEVSVSDGNWRVSHNSASGFKYERTSQYNVIDTSTVGAMSWSGTYHNNPNWRLIGRILTSPNGEQLYIEQLYDTRNNTIIATTQAKCKLSPNLALKPLEHYQTPEIESAVSIRPDGGVFVVPATINGQLTLDFIVDSGASDVCVPTDVVSTLVRTRTITTDDFIGSKTYQLADGSNVPSQRFVIRSLKVGNKVLSDVTASITPVAGKLLLGQSFLSRFRSWTIDNERSTLTLNGDGTRIQPPPILSSPFAPPAAPIVSPPSAPPASPIVSPPSPPPSVE